MQQAVVKSACVRMIAPIHPNELARLQSLRATALLDTRRDRRFDEIVFTVAQLCNAPLAGLSLIDEDRQWYKAIVGLPPGTTTIPRAIAFCSFTILGTDVFTIGDASTDLRFAASPLVTGPPYVRFYAGVPLMPHGLAIGGLCVAAREPRRLTPEQHRGLVALGQQAEDLIRERTFN